MIFEIHNIGKIQKASIEMRGITVIAGNNNTGKSTYGKILYCMFNAFRNSKSAIYEERKRAIENILISFRNFAPGIKIRTLVNSIIKQQPSQEKLRCLLEKAVSNEIIFLGKSEDNAINDAVEKIIRSGKVTDEQIRKTILTRFLTSEFGKRIVHVNHTEGAGTISLKIKGNMLSASIKNNECIDFIDDVGIIPNVLYIDTPFILDEIAADSRYRSNGNGHREYLRRSLSKSSVDVSAVEEILAKEQLQRILSNIRSVVNGEFKKLDDDLMFQEDGLNTPLGMFNISTGMKPFLIIKRLLESGEIEKLGVLVFDEPEIHLHPEWQLKYAELLVLLQREFNLNILLTTHSPYFLNTVEVYSQRHNIADRCNYYLTDTQGDVCGIQEVAGNLDLVYEKLAKPFQELESLRYRED
jgi:predicted ATP-dependent endonuclease of OLD family